MDMRNDENPYSPWHERRAPERESAGEREGEMGSERGVSAIE